MLLIFSYLGSINDIAAIVLKRCTTLAYGFCQSVQSGLITDKLRGYGASKRVVMPAWLIDSIGTRTRRRIHTNRRASGRGECGGSNPLGTPSGSLRYMGSLLRTSALAATCSPPVIIDNFAANDSGFGMK